MGAGAAIEIAIEELCSKGYCSLTNPRVHLKSIVPWLTLDFAGFVRVFYRKIVFCVSVIKKNTRTSGATQRRSRKSEYVVVPRCSMSLTESELLRLGMSGNQKLRYCLLVQN
jgi:hypothetical protein